MVYFFCMPKKRRGFTLVEVMVSIVIMTVIVGAILGFFSHYLGFVMGVERQLMAVNLASQTMEEIYWDPVLVTTPSTDDPILAGAMGNARNPTRNFSVVNNRSNRYRIVTTTVRWE